MNTTAALQLINNLLLAAQAAQTLKPLVEAARSAGRDITDEELKVIADLCQSDIDKAKALLTK